MDASKGCDTCRPPPSTHKKKEVRDAEDVSLDFEPTDPVDRNREYPPIVTADGRVDTDIDHLMENAEDEVTDAEVQDIPSQFPQPHVIGVISGSLDDDIDRLFNKDGTMTHTLVDPPKNFKPEDLKEINSKSPSPSQTTKKENPTINSHHQASTYLDRIMSQDGADEESTASKVVSDYERNNSSKAPTINGDDADFCHLKQSLDEGFPSLPPDLDKVNVTSKETLNEFLPVFGHIKETEGGVELLDEQKPDGSNGGIDENAEESSKWEDMSEVENASTIDKCEVTEAGDITREGSVENENVELPQDNVLHIVEQFLKTMSKEELEKRLGIESDSVKLFVTENEEQKTKLSASDETKEDETPNSEESSCALKSEHKEVIQVNTVGDQTSAEPKSQKEPEESEKPSNIPTPPPSMQETMSLLKQSLETITKDSFESSQITESQKMLAVTALKVAGDSMNAAAKMADALTLLVQSTQAGNHPVAAQCLPPKIQDRVHTPSTTMSEPSIIRSDSDNQSRKTNQHLEREVISASPEKKNTAKIAPNFGTSIESHTDEQDEVNHSVQEDEAVERQKLEGKEKSRMSKEKKDYDGKTHESKTSRRHREHYERSARKSSDRRKRDAKHNGLKEEHHRKRSSRKAEEYLVVEDEEIIDEEKLYSRRADMDMKMWETAQKRQRSRDNADDFYNGSWVDADNLKARNRHASDAGKRREKRKNDRDDHYKKSRSSTSSPQNRGRSAYKSEEVAAHNINESHTPRMYSVEYPTGHLHAKTSSRNHRESCEDASSTRKSTSCGSHTEEEEEEVFGKSSPWTLPNGDPYPMKGECYFDEVVRQLKPFSPTRDPNAHYVDPCKEYFRAKLVGTCVDPNARDSDFDSIEFNANARPSESTRVHFDDEEEWCY